MVRRLFFSSLLLTFAMIFLLPNVYAFYDTFQYHPNDNLSIADTVCGSVWYIEDVGDVIIITEDINNKITHMSGGGSPGDPTRMKLTAPLACSNYWSFYVGDVKRGHKDAQHWHIYIKFYNSSGGYINRSNDLYWTFVNYNNSHWELLRSGNTIALYVNGEYIRDIGRIWDEMPCYIEFHIYCSYCAGPRLEVRIDDVMTAEDGIISALPIGWYILRNWDNPDTNGLYKEDGTTRVSTHTFNVRYMWRNVTSYSERNPPCDKIIIKHFTSGEIVNQTSIPSQSFGNITYNFTEMLFHENPQNDKYGLYEIDLMRGGDTIAQDWFFFTFASAEKTSSGTISWEKDSYASGEIARIHTNITNPDFTTYLYLSLIHISEPTRPY